MRPLAYGSIAWLFAKRCGSSGAHAAQEPLDPHLLASASSLTDALVRVDVLRALGALPPRHRVVVALHHYADLNSREIAEILGIPDGTVRYLLSLARRQLESLLASHRPTPLSEVLFDAG